MSHRFCNLQRCFCINVGSLIKIVGSVFSEHKMVPAMPIYFVANLLTELFGNSWLNTHGLILCPLSLPYLTPLDNCFWSFKNQVYKNNTIVLTIYKNLLLIPSEHKHPWEVL